ncbi:N-formylglutamate amidohydrolase [Halomonas koreensis]|uniref:N-formylglutamate amidohydrolase n=1 Tax=Halomonas koreensis TaxID=245385 RepID=A0ABU1G421_9GAMM|nr:N-formylglutamate amidohydrolase [Halomonas koreensis]MDR5867650.1 N-formylglutamate amidohydrolase [Halomonas koreensis]
MSSEVEPSSESIEIHNGHAHGPVVILCEHASHHIPDAYQDLGLDPVHRQSHVAWDPGARGLALRLSASLDAPLVASRVSRLVYDCNRPPEAPDAMPECPAGIEVPGNRALTASQRASRVEAVYRPFCQAVQGVLTARAARGLATALITIHSFTPRLHGRTRAVELGILHDADRRLADALLEQARRLPHRRIRRNAPYGPEDGVTHSLKRHGERHGLANVMIEVRNDLLATSQAEAAMARELLRLIRPALSTLGFEPEFTPQGGMRDA